MDIIVNPLINLCDFNCPDGSDSPSLMKLRPLWVTRSWQPKGIIEVLKPEEIDNDGDGREKKKYQELPSGDQRFFFVDIRYFTSLACNLKDSD